MNNAKTSVEKQFEGSILTTSQISSLVKWLQTPPKTTTIRLNLLQTTADNAKKHIEKALQQCQYLSQTPLIESFDPIPEIILIRNIDENLICSEPRPECKEIIIDIPCASAVLRGAHIYGPGVLAMQSNTKIDEIVNIFADLEGTCKRGTNVVHESSRKQFIGIGKVKMQRFLLFAHDGFPRGIAVQVHQTVSCVPSIGSDYLGGQFGILQNFPSIVCSRVLDPKPNDIVLDMCASPGNKTTHLAQLMEDKGLIIALDKSDKRVSVLKENVEKFGFQCIRCYCLDATKAISNINANVATGNLSPPFAEHTFDKILVDAPCSGLGNRPVLSAKMSQKIRDSFPKVQKRLLETAVKLLKINGVLVYSTCTVLEAENELNVAWLLQKYCGKIQLELAVPMFGQNGLPNAGLSDAERKMVQRFGPNLEDNNTQNACIDSTGFFICKFRKVA